MTGRRLSAVILGSFVVAVSPCGISSATPFALRPTNLPKGFDPLTGPLPGSWSMSLAEVRTRLAAELHCTPRALAAYALRGVPKDARSLGPVQQAVLTANLRCPDRATAVSAFRDLSQDYLVEPNWRSAPGPKLGQSHVYAISTTGVSIGPGADAAVALWRDGGTIQLIVVAGPSASTLGLVESLARSQQKAS